MFVVVFGVTQSCTGASSSSAFAAVFCVTQSYTGAISSAFAAVFGVTQSCTGASDLSAFAAVLGNKSFSNADLIFDIVQLIHILIYIYAIHTVFFIQNNFLTIQKLK